jgi:hypothetical protein
MLEKLLVDRRERNNMGVDWLTCNYCGETFPDCGDYVYCEECGTRWCSVECAEADGYVWDETSEHFETCKFCRGEDHTDEVLLEFALELLKMDREDLIEEYNIKESGEVGE